MSKVYGYGDCGCRYEVPSKEEFNETVNGINDELSKITKVDYVTATNSTAMGYKTIVLPSDIITAKSFIEVFPANDLTLAYLNECLKSDIAPLVAGETLTIFVNEVAENGTLDFIIKSSYLASGSKVYIHLMSSINEATYETYTGEYEEN